jgi:hypothetical protein
MILTPRKFVSSSQGRAIVAVDVVGGLEPCEFAVVVVVGKGKRAL